MATVHHVAPVLYTLFVWWFSTGVILYLDGLPRWTFKWTMSFATVVLVLALVGLATTRNDTRISGAYLAFSYAVLVWAWQEVAFLLGYVTGPRRTPCPPDATGWRRARYALQAVLHHELALIVLGIAVAVVTWGGANHTGLACFVVFWVMRQSAKLNVFLGVRNLNESFLPAHLQYLQSYFKRRSMNPLFPISVLLSTWLAVLAWQGALASGIGRFEGTAATFIGTLLALAILEHWFMVLPMPSELLWRWGLRSRVRADTVGTGPA